MPPLHLGDMAPQFELKDDQGKTFSLQEALQRGPVVLFFYPKDETGGCIQEVCGFRDGHDELQSLGAQVYGISKDGEDSHKKFRSHYSLPYHLLSDPRGRVAELYGVSKRLGIIPGRKTFVLESSGRVRLAFSSLLAFQEHMEKALASVQSLHNS